MDPNDRRVKRIRNNTIAGVASLLLVVAYLTSIGFNPGRKMPVSSDPQQSAADKTATQLHVTRYDVNGEIRHQLNTAFAEIYTLANSGEEYDAQRNDDGEDSFLLPSDYQQQHSSNVINLRQPLLTIHQPDNNVATVTARQGQLTPSNHRIQLDGDVTVLDSANHSTISTDSLTIDTEQKQAFTQSAVTLTHPDSLTTAIGLQGNLTQQHWQLLSDVKSTIYME